MLLVAPPQTMSASPVQILAVLERSLGSPLEGGGVVVDQVLPASV